MFYIDIRSDCGEIWVQSWILDFTTANSQQKERRVLVVLKKNYA